MKANAPHDVFKYVSMPNDVTDPIPCWLWEGSREGRDKRGVFMVNGRKYQAHRLVWELINGRELEPGEVLRHSCDVPHCCSPHHLTPGTQKQNMVDMVQRQRVGMSHERVQEIMKWITLEAPHTWIAEKFGISRQSVQDIATRRRYASVPWPTGDKDNE